MHLANTSTRVIAALLGAALLSLSACETREPVDPYYFMQPQLPVITPMKIDRAGAKYVMHFWVLPEQSSRRVRPFFIGVRLAQSTGESAETLIEIERFFIAADIPVRVKLAKLDAPTEKKSRCSHRRC